MASSLHTDRVPTRLFRKMGETFHRGATVYDRVMAEKRYAYFMSIDPTIVPKSTVWEPRVKNEINVMMHFASLFHIAHMIALKSCASSELYTAFMGKISMLIKTTFNIDMMIPLIGKIAKGVDHRSDDFAAAVCMMWGNAVTDVSFAIPGKKPRWNQNASAVQKQDVVAFLKENYLLSTVARGGGNIRGKGKRGTTSGGAPPPPSSSSKVNEYVGAFERVIKQTYDHLKPNKPTDGAGILWDRDRLFAVVYYIIHTYAATMGHGNPRTYVTIVSHVHNALLQHGANVVIPVKHATVQKSTYGHGEDTDVFRSEVQADFYTYDLSFRDICAVEFGEHVGDKRNFTSKNVNVFTLDEVRECLATIVSEDGGLTGRPPSE